MPTLKTTLDKIFVESGGSIAKFIKDFTGYFVFATWTVNTPAAKAFASATDVDTATDYITEVAHGFLTGLIGQMTTSATLPTGLSLATDYFIIEIDDDTYQLASSLANALAGTAVDITAIGSGDQTFTPTALAGASIKLQGSAKAIPTTDADWDDIPDSSVDITASDKESWNVTTAHYHNFRYYITLASGQIDVVADLNVKRIV